MGFQFNGIFAVADKPVFDMALQRWPFCRGRRIKTPFVGFGLAGPDPNDAETDTDAELLLAQIDDLATGLPTWSQQFPAITLLRWLGVKQDHTYFPPFERSYFAVPSEH